MNKFCQLSVEAVSICSCIKFKGLRCWPMMKHIWALFHCTTNKIWTKQGVWNLMAVLIWLLCWLEQIDCFSEIMALSLGARKTGQMVLYQAPCSSLCPADTFFCWIYMLPYNYCLLESFSQGALFGFVNMYYLSCPVKCCTKPAFSYLPSSTFQ